ncbi:MAG: glutamine-hydrolyzing carbamoyl-phosphate synthase small subunit [Firmicutes bacterium]|nr:glutamine-hydrolyzing carbamoyl-phosphate synthase small subunit [Bacillota bacterium]
MMAVLVLEDGTMFTGEAFGARGRVTGEVVFNTGMTGYQEVLTDPSYCGQIVTMTYPLIGNYGINMLDRESSKPQVRGFIVREYCEYPSNWRCEGDLDTYLKGNNIIALSGIDTRALTKKIREQGTMMGMISTDMPPTEEIYKLKNQKLSHPVDMVSTREAYTIPGNDTRIAMLDFGVKGNIINSLKNRGCTLMVYPSHCDAETILRDAPDAIVLTNGPGDPKENEKAIDTIRVLMNKKPIMGICLGHQLLALASGADTEKLKYGHRGCNHPVVDVLQQRVYITSQNHGYTIVENSLDTKKIEVTHRNLNDGSIEGIRFIDRPVFSVQFHPEACPGPKDSAYLFDNLFSLIK